MFQLMAFLSQVRVSVPKTGSVLMLKEALQRLVDTDSNKVSLVLSPAHRILVD